MRLEKYNLNNIWNFIYNGLNFLKAYLDVLWMRIVEFVQAFFWFLESGSLCWSNMIKHDRFMCLSDYLLENAE